MNESVMSRQTTNMIREVSPTTHNWGFRLIYLK
jgi:hypothetical protein